MFQGILAFPLGEFWLPQTTGRAMMGGKIDSDGHPHGGAAAAAVAAVAAVTAANATATVLPMARPRGVSCPTPLPGSVPAAAAAAAVALLLALPLAPAAHGRGGAADSWRASSARGTTEAVQTAPDDQPGRSATVLTPSVAGTCYVPTVHPGGSFLVPLGGRWGAGSAPKGAGRPGQVSDKFHPDPFIPSRHTEAARATYWLSDADPLKWLSEGWWYACKYDPSVLPD